MPISTLANMSAPVLSATILMNPPASQYRPERPPLTPDAGRRRVRPRRTWRATVKSVARPFVPFRVRRKVRLVLIASNPAPEQRVAAEEGRRAA